MPRLEPWSDPLESASNALRKLIDKDDRVIAFSQSSEGVFIYTNPNMWVRDGTLKGTFRGCNVVEAIRNFQSDVVERPPSCSHCKDRGWYWSYSLAPYRIPCSCQIDEDDEHFIGK